MIYFLLIVIINLELSLCPSIGSKRILANETKVPFVFDSVSEKSVIFYGWLLLIQAF